MATRKAGTGSIDPTIQKRLKEAAGDAAREVVEALASRRVLTGEDLLRGVGAKPFEVPELGGVVYLRSLPAGDVLDFSSASDDNRHDAILTLIAKAAVTPDGQPLFSPDQVARLREMSITVFMRLSSAVTEMAGLTAKPSNADAGGEGNASGGGTVVPPTSALPIV